MGVYQIKNIIGVLNAIDILNERGYDISTQQVKDGFSKVIDLTGLKGRWQTLSKSPTVLCDTAHNVGGIVQVLDNLKKVDYNNLWMILGFVSDKDISTILSLLPTDANYIFCQANIQRALPANELLEKANSFSLKGIANSNVNEAIDYAILNANPDDFIYVGGSTFVVAEINNL